MPPYEIRVRHAKSTNCCICDSPWLLLQGTQNRLPVRQTIWQRDSFAFRTAAGQWTARQRRGFVNLIIEFAICDTAAEADDAAVTPETTAHPVAPWAMAWRARSAAWMIRHRRTLEAALTRGAP